MSSQNYSGGQFSRPDNRFSAAAAANQPYHMQRPSVSGSTDSVGSIANSMQNLHVSRPMAPLFTPAGTRPVNAGIPGFQPPNQGPVAVNTGLPGSQPQNQGPVPVTSVARPAPATIFTAPSATRPVPLTRPGPPPAFAPASNAVRPGPPGAPINTAARPGPPTTAVTRPGPPTRPPFGSAGPLTAPPSKVNASTTVTPTSGAPYGPFSTELTNGSSASIQGAYSSPSQFPPNSNAMVQPFISSSQIRGPPAVQPSSAGLGRAPQIQGQRLPSPATFPSAPPPATFPSAPPPGTFPTAPPPGTFPSATLPPTSLASTAGSIPPFQAPSFGAQQHGYPAFSPVRPVASAPGVPGMPSFRGPHQHVPPVPPSMGYLSAAGVMGMPQPGSPATGTSAASRIDPNQIPRPQATSDALVFETRVNNEANLPPPASSEFIARDTGNCSPRYMRCTLNQIPCTGDLANTSGMPLALMVQPFALTHPSEEAIQVVDFGESGPVRCSQCKAYINPFMRFIDQGRRFICNLCGCNNETPRDYHCNLGPDGRRRDADVRPELCRGAVEFVATREYMVREPMPPVFFFLIDVSMNAIKTGATAAACSAISRAIEDLAENPRVKVGIASFDSTIHFYSLNTSLQQPSMLVIPDVQDVYTPLETDLIVPISECRQLLEQLLESIPSLFKDSKVPESAFGAAIKGAFLALKISGGKLLVFQSVLPSVGIGALSAREAEGRAIISAGEKEAHKLLQPADKTFKTMAIEFAEFQVCVDLFLTSQIYVDIASISTVPRTTGGQVYYYFPFSAITDSAKLYNDLRWNIIRPQGFEAVMRVRSSQGLQVQEYYGNFCKRIPTDVDLPAIDCDKTIMVTFKHDDKFQEGSECCFQCALLYTTTFGERRIRVTTLSLPCTSVLGNLFRGADLDAQFTYFLKQAANSIPTTPLVQLREQATNLCVNILHTYRKYCATASSSGQLILPEGLKFLPLYELALTKSIGLRANVRVDDRSYWLTRVASLSTPLAVPLVYPRMFAVHKLSLKDSGEGVLPQTLPLSSENLDSDGAFLLENGEDAFIYLGKSVNSDILQKLFGVNSIEEIPDPYLLQQHDNDLSRRLNDIVNEIRRQRCSYLRLRLCKRDNSDFLFLSSMVEDKNNLGTSYVDYLVHIHRQIQAKMSKESQ